MYLPKVYMDLKYFCKKLNLSYNSIFYQLLKSLHILLKLTLFCKEKNFLNDSYVLLKQP